jgi:hypothetical protein
MYREQLRSTLNQAAATIRDEVQASRHGLGTLILRLRPEAIAKSHRPAELVAESGLLPAGHERIEEMLVAADASSLGTFDQVIQLRDTRKIRANLSAIATIEAWGPRYRVPTGTRTLRERGRAILRLFRYGNANTNAQVEEVVLETLKEFRLRFDPLDSDSFGRSVLRLVGLTEASDDVLARLANLAGVRRIVPEPVAMPTATVFPVGVAPSLSFMLPPTHDLPTVGIFDTGVSSLASQVHPWINGSDPYVLPPETDYQHGTNVASLVAAARQLNSNHDELPSLGAFVHDVCGVETNGGNVSDLIERLKDAIPKRPDVKVWNLSLGVPSPCDEQTFSDFAMALDRLSDKYGVLFVVAAGNYVDLPRRIWPAGAILQDRIGSPAEATRVLTVGSVCHLAGPESLNSAGEPAAYSRRGPGPVFTPKPDLVHAGGNVHSPWAPGNTSMHLVMASNMIGYSFGTSFAAPVAATMAAHVWRSLENTQQSPSPALVKALMIHAAQLSSPPYSTAERRYFGAGLPLDVLDCLYDTPDSFTLLFEADLASGMRWRKSPYPLPASLMHEGKLRAEVIITCVYAPPLDHTAGAEYVRANVELSFGVLNGDNISSKVPMTGEDYTDGYEAAQVENGGKWAPVKIHRKSFPNGVAGDTWALQARPYLRAFEPSLARPIRTYIVCTLRSLTGNTAVHEDGLRALAATNWTRAALPVRVPVRA